MWVETSVALAIVVAISEGLKILFAFLKSKYQENKGQKNPIEDKLDKLIAIISKEDDDGIPLTYVPRRLLSQQENYIDLLKNLTYNAEMTSKTLDKVSLTLDSVVRVLDKLEDRHIR